MKNSQRLIDAWLDGTMNSADAAELNAWLRESNRHVRQFTDAVALNRLLRESFAERAAATRWLASGELAAEEIPAVAPNGPRRTLHAPGVATCFDWLLFTLLRLIRGWRPRRLDEAAMPRTGRPVLAAFSRRALGWGATAVVVAVSVIVWLASPPQVQLVNGVGRQFAAGETVATNREMVGRGFNLSAGLVEHPESTPLRDVDDFDLPIETVAVFTESTRSGPGGSREFAQRMSTPTTLNVKSGAAQFESIGGADIRVDGPALFGLSSDASGVLFDGSVQARLTKPDATYSVLISNLKVLDLGTEFRVRAIDDNQVEVEVLDGEVAIQSRSRLPLFFWNFESSIDGLADAVVQQPGTLKGSARLVPGIIGDGAIEFDNTTGAMVRLDGGTGEKVGTGRFACSSGISIEVMVVSRWSGQWEDYDEIFRKNDGLYRVLLAFQHDYSRYTVPPIPSCPCLTLGLYLEGHQFVRLAMPLDGRDGRPSLEALTDGRPHHIVGTYDSFSGLKSLYVDGQLRYQHQYAVGTLILSGGPESAVIGNASDNPRLDNRAYNKSTFNGLIDEVAYYDFALTPAEVAEHHRQVTVGANYFGGDMQQLQAPPWKGVTRLVKGDKVVFDRHQGAPVGFVPTRGP